MTAKGANRSKYCQLIRQHLQLSMEKARLETTLNERQLRRNQKYVKLDKQINSIEAQMDSIINDLEERDFHEFFRRLDNEE